MFGKLLRSRTCFISQSPLNLLACTLVGRKPDRKTAGSSTGGGTPCQTEYENVGQFRSSFVNRNHVPKISKESVGAVYEAKVQTDSVSTVSCHRTQALPAPPTQRDSYRLPRLGTLRFLATYFPEKIWHKLGALLLLVRNLGASHIYQ